MRKNIAYSNVPIGDDFKPGDVITRLYDGGTSHSWVVQDPVRTGHGKLRVQGVGAKTVSTSWWTPTSLGGVGRWRIDRP